MLVIPEKHRGAAWSVWRALALAASLVIAQRLFKAGPTDLLLDVGAAGLWLVIGWNTKRPAITGTITGVLVLGAAMLVRGAPASLAVFLPLWAVLFALPNVMRKGSPGSRFVLGLGRLFTGLADALARLDDRLNRDPRLLEGMRITLACLAGFVAMRPFMHNGIMGGVDAQWYTAVVADHLEQWRLGMGPVFAGQTRYAAIGTVMPIRVAPYLQHLALLMDLLTGRTLAPYLVLNLALVFSGITSGLSAYLCLRSILPTRRLEALLLSIVYVWSPGVVGLAFLGQLFMSTTTLPFIPLVFAGLVRVFKVDGFSGWAMVASGCAACWLAHSPIGLWISAIAAVVIVTRWILGQGRSLREVGRVAGAALLFLALCGYVFLSIRLLEAPKQPPIVAGMLPPILSSLFPAVLEPVTATAGATSDLQPGWSVLLAFIAGLAAAVITRSKMLYSMVAAAVLLLCLSLPVPFLNNWLWQLVPQAVLNVTNAVPTQRLFPILAGCAVTLAAAALSLGIWRRRWAIAVLILGVVWSASELRLFLHRGSLIANSPETSAQLMSQNNLIATTFSTGLLPGPSPFSSYGFLDYTLEQRVFEGDENHYVVTDVESVAPGFGFGHPLGSSALTETFKGTPAADGRRWIDILPRLTLAPRQHYLLAFDFAQTPYTGVLQIQGVGLNHEYFLPDSGERLSFGSGIVNSRVVPLYNPTDAPLVLTLDFVVQDPNVNLEQFRSFSHYRLVPYDPEGLPIRLRSFAPYVTEVRTPKPGYFESFRYYIPGWTATVNGRSAPVTKTLNGLVAVRVPAGESEVRLAYSAPAPLWVAYILTGISWVALAVVAIKYSLGRQFSWARRAG